MKKVIAFFAIVLVVIAVVFVFMKYGFGTGGRGGEGKGEVECLNSDIDDKEAEKKSSTIIVKVEDDKIYLNDELCNSVEELKDKIGKLESEETETKYMYDDEFGIKAIADEVEDAMHRLQDTLGIYIEFK